MTSEAAVYGLWLNVKGKVVADSFILGDEHQGFWVGSYFAAAEVIRDRLESHVIADDVVITDRTETWAALTVFGDDSAERVAVAKRQLSQPSFVVSGRRSRASHVEWLFAADESEHPRSVLGATEDLDGREIARRRIDAGIPAVPMDIGATDLPNEGGLDADAISYTKGCYLGQEVMARLKSMGQVRRRLLRVTGIVPADLRPPANLYRGDRAVGELRSVATEAGGQMIGLALLSLLHVTAETPLSLAPGGEPRIRLLDQP